jgi:cytochrome c oxidase assembly factor CtaG
MSAAMSRQDDPPSILSVETMRIIPLGLTAQEAAAWYRHEVILPRIGRGLLAIGIGVVIAFSLLTPVGLRLDSTLALHMVAEHLLIVVTGFLLAYGTTCLVFVGSRVSRPTLRTRAALLKANSALNKRGMATFAMVAIMMVYWQIPQNFDTAALNGSTHLAMHFTFLIVGGLIFAGSRMLPRRTRQIAPIIAGKMLGACGMFLLITQSYLYSVYPFSEQSETGLVLVVMMLLMDFTIVPYWLYNYFGSTSIHSST